MLIVESTRVRDSDTQAEAKRRAKIHEILCRVKKDAETLLGPEEIKVIEVFLDELGICADD